MPQIATCSMCNCNVEIRATVTLETYFTLGTDGNWELLPGHEPVSERVYCANGHPINRSSLPDIPLKGLGVLHSSEETT